MFALAMLLALAPTETVLSEDEVRQLKMEASARGGEGVVQVRSLKGKKLEAALRGAVEDKTRAMLVDGFGIYLVHTAPDGRLSAWFPGRTASVGGTWGVQRFSSKLIVLCQRFDRPEAPRSGPFEARECAAADRTLGNADTLRQWGGDPFNLGSGRVPFVKQTYGLPTP